MIEEKLKTVNEIKDFKEAEKIIDTYLDLQIQLETPNRNGMIDALKRHKKSRRMRYRTESFRKATPFQCSGSNFLIKICTENLLNISKDCLIMQRKKLVKKLFMS